MIYMYVLMIYTYVITWPMDLEKWFIFSE